MIEIKKIVGVDGAGGGGDVLAEVMDATERTVWELEVAYLEAREPGFREALERFISDGSSDATDPIGDAGERLIR